MTVTDLTDNQKKAFETYHDNECDTNKAAKELGIGITSLKKTLFVCARKGHNVTPDNYCEHAPAGFGLTKSTLDIKDGKVVRRWDRISPLEQNIEDFLDRLKDRVPVLGSKIKAPKKPNKDLCVEWLLYDHHHGMYSWAKETGANYDVEISSKLIVKASEKIFGQVGQVAEAVIVLGGDTLHSDNRRGVTELSGHALDVDGRYHNTLPNIYQSMVCAIDNALLYAKKVRVVVLSGNHDWHSAIALSCIIKAHYRQVGRVSVDTSACQHRFHRWGQNYYMYTHGNTGGKRLAGYMLQHLVQNDIVGVRRMFVRQGHLHKTQKTVMPNIDEIDGVIVETFPTLAAPDSFAAENAYVSNRATVANLWHKEYGQRSRLEIGASELLD